MRPSRSVQAVLMSWVGDRADLEEVGDGYLAVRVRRRDDVDAVLEAAEMFERAFGWVVGVRF